MLKFHATPFYWFIFVYFRVFRIPFTAQTKQIEDYCSYFCFNRHQSHPLPPSLLALFQLYQNTSTVLGMQEDDGLIMRSNLWLRIESPNIFGLQILDSSVHIIHLECVRKTLFTEFLPLPPVLYFFPSYLYLNTDVVNTSILVLFQKLGDGTLLAQRMEQFNLGVSKIDEDGVHAMFR